MKMISVILGCLAASIGLAADWPCFAGNNHRTGVTNEAVAVDRLGLSWSHQRTTPNPAWAGPAKWDAYAGIRGLKSMRNYDVAYHSAIAGGKLFYGSSTENAVICLDAKSGKVAWIAPTDGPVRIAPTIVEDRVYVGSDDGYAYCLSVKDGSILWRFSPVPDHTRILNNGHLISPWPIRTGVIVQDGTAYFGASMLPWQSSWICAVDAKTGKPEGDGRYSTPIGYAGDPKAQIRNPKMGSGLPLTMEGPIVVSDELLILPQGRIPPQLFRRSDGKMLGSLKGGGGSFVLVTEDKNVVFGPGGKRKGGVQESPSTAGKAAIASHAGGNAVVVDAGVSYVLSDNALVALDRATKKNLWTLKENLPFALIKAGKHLFVGGVDRVVAVDATSGKKVWESLIEGRAFGLAVADGALFVSTDSGSIYRFAAGADARTTLDIWKGNYSTSNESLRGVQPVDALNDQDLLHRLVFHRAEIDASSKANPSDVSGGTVKNQASELTGTVLGTGAVNNIGGLEALTLDGKTTSVLFGGRDSALPTKAFTASAWVRIDADQKWGGILNAVQDNGNFERGWIFGYNGRRFSIGIVGKDSAPKLEYLKAPKDFKLKNWYHVAATYDGATTRLFVDGEKVAESATTKGDINYADSLFFEAGAYHDKDEYFRMQGQLHEVRVYKKALDPAAVAKQYQEKSRFFSSTVELAAGPWIQFAGTQDAVVRWRTAEPSPSILHVRLGDEKVVFGSPDLVRAHEVRARIPKRNRIYHYSVEVKSSKQNGITEEHECDTFFNYALPTVPVGRAWTAGATVKAAVNAAGTDQGVCVILGAQDGALALDVARQSRYRVVLLDDDAKRIASIRARLLGSRLYGSRFLAYAVKDLQNPGIVDGFANLVLSERNDLADDAGVMNRAKALLQPGRGVGFIGGKKLMRGQLPDSGVWTHQYGLPNNSAYGGETLGGKSGAQDMDVQWIGRPGPRYQSDRENRQSAPLAVNGRMFMQGLYRVLAVDMYNGTVLWNMELPAMARFNVAKDCANWCADEDFLYIAIRGRCWKIDARTGRVAASFAATSGMDWAFVATVGSTIIGTSYPKGTAYTDWWGGKNWYDGKNVAKVVSDDLTAYDKKTGKVLWRYEGGLPVNPTISIDEDRIYFVESRNKDAIAKDNRRFSTDDIWADFAMVAVDLKTGRRVWQASLDGLHRGIGALFAATGEGQVAIVSSGASNYEMRVFDATSGKLAWKKQIGLWKKKEHHGTHLSRPAIVSGKLMVRPYVFNLKTGEKYEKQMPFITEGHGCGTYACTKDAVLLRSGNTSIWDHNSGVKTGWARMRPGCWLSTIPAGGMVLSPEGGGGCSCGSWMETSVVFMPNVHRLK